jgi:hypothetical protein
MGTGVKQLGHEADHSLPSSAAVNYGTMTSIPPYIFMVLCLIKYMNCLHGIVYSYAQGQLYLILSYLPVIKCSMSLM